MRLGVLEDQLDDAVAVRPDLIIIGPDDDPALGLEPGISSPIGFLAPWLKVGWAIDLNNQSMRPTRQVSNVGTYRFLTPKLHAQRSILDRPPENGFGSCRSPPEFTGEYREQGALLGIPHIYQSSLTNLTSWIAPDTLPALWADRASPAPRPLSGRTNWDIVRGNEEKRTQDGSVFIAGGEGGI